MVAQSGQTRSSEPECGRLSLLHDDLQQPRRILQAGEEGERGDSVPKESDRDRRADGELPDAVDRPGAELHQRVLDLLRDEEARDRNALHREGSRDLRARVRVSLPKQHGRRGRKSSLRLNRQHCVPQRCGRVRIRVRLFQQSDYVPEGSASEQDSSGGEAPPDADPRTKLPASQTTNQRKPIHPPPKQQRQQKLGRATQEFLCLRQRQKRKILVDGRTKGSASKHELRYDDHLRPTFANASAAPRF